MTSLYTLILLQKVANIMSRAIFDNLASRPTRTKLIAAYEEQYAAFQMVQKA